MSTSPLMIKALDVINDEQLDLSADTERLVDLQVRAGLPSVVEDEREHRIDPKLGQKARLGAQRREPDGIGPRVEELRRMRFESEHRQGALARLRLGARLRNQRLMPAMDAIEIPDGNNRSLIDRRHILEMAEDAHALAFGTLRGHHKSLARHHDRIAHRTDAIQHHAPALADFANRAGRRHRIADPYRRFKFEFGGNEDRAFARQLRADHRRDETDRKHAMRNPAAKQRAAGILFVEMNGVVVAGGVPEHLKIPFGDGFLHGGGLTDLQVFVIDAYHLSALMAALAPTLAASNIRARCWAV